MENRNLFLTCIATLLAIVWLAPPTGAQVNYDVDPKLSQDGTPIPDVDKPNIADQSCWLATAANVLGAAGWGQGADAQAKAMNIYQNDLMPHFGNGQWLGWSNVAINWWLLNQGYNSNSPDYNPTLRYNNVTIVRAVGAGFAMPQYDAILRELPTCQYVNVAFDPPSPGHEMTLVGGNYWNNSNFPNNQPVSLWNDNNGDAMAGQNTEISINVIGPNNEWRVNHRNINPFYRPNVATILCPGLQKDDTLMKNFDVAYFKDMVFDDLTGSPKLVNNSRIAGINAGIYQLPSGQIGIEWTGSTSQPEIMVPNLEMPEPWYKEIELLVDYVDRNVLAANPNIANILVKVGNNLYVPDSITWTADQGQALFHWKLDELIGQPGWESIVFPDASYKNLFDISTGLGGPVKDWNLATLCVPEPSACFMMALAAMLWLGYIQFRRR